MTDEAIAASVADALSARLFSFCFADAIIKKVTTLSMMYYFLGGRNPGAFQRRFATMKPHFHGPLKVDSILHSEKAQIGSTEAAVARYFNA